MNMYSFSAFERTRPLAGKTSGLPFAATLLHHAVGSFRRTEGGQCVYPIKRSPKTHVLFSVFLLFFD